MLLEAIPWWGLLPFVTLLLCIATLPLIPVTSHWWEKHWFQLGLALALGLPVAAWITAMMGLKPVTHALIEYSQFICLLGTLFAVSGGIFVAGDLKASPKNNTILLGLGTLMASFVGTTGAAMLLIRPLLNTNQERQYKSHSVIFFIFTVSNCGGMLTPLGDPPLFMGMLRGVPFTWTFSLFPQWLFVNALLLLTYYAMDSVFYAKEDEYHRTWDDLNVDPINVLGRINFAFLGLIVLAVAFVPSLDLHAIEAGTAAIWAWVPWREVVMLTAAVLSFTLGSREVRYEMNKFNWGPIIEVASLFIGIFLTMVPALKYLAQVAPTLPLNKETFFLFSGSLSAVLDNAPTYVSFFEMGQALGPNSGLDLVAGVPVPYLVSISLGSVFCGAVTYIGNGPNFMVKAVAENQSVAMPSFGGYIVWAVRYLVPALASMFFIFIMDGIWTTMAGVAIAVVLVALALNQIRKGRALLAAVVDSYDDADIE